MRKNIVKYGMIAAASMMLSLGVAPSTAYAQTTYEKESNDTIDQAVAMLPNASYQGLMDSETDVDYYKFTTTVDGIFQLSFKQSNMMEKIDHAWDVTIYDEDGNTIYTQNNVTNFKTYNFTFAKGHTFYICVKGTYSDNWCPVGSEYKIKVNAVKSSVWETEDNNTLSTSDSIQLNKTYYGNFQQDNDVDCYKFKVTKDGYFKLNFDLASIDETVSHGFNITLYQNGKEFYTVQDVRDKFSTPNFSFKKGATYYAKITPLYADNWCPKGVDYKFNVKFTASSTWEKEANNSTKTATAIKKDTSYTGTIYKENDMDYFAYVAGGNEKLAVKFGKKSMDDNINYGWNVQVLVNNKTKLKKENITDLTKTLGKITLKKGDKVVVKVTPTYSDSWAPLYKEYTLKLAKTK